MVNGQLEDSLRHEIESFIEGRLSAIKQEITSLQSQLNESLSSLLERHSNVQSEGSLTSAIGEHLRAAHERGVELAAAESSRAKASSDMAIIKAAAAQRTLSEPAEVAAFLSRYGVDYERWSPDRPLAADLLDCGGEPQRARIHRRGEHCRQLAVGFLVGGDELLRRRRRVALGEMPGRDDAQRLRLAHPADHRLVGRVLCGDQRHLALEVEARPLVEQAHRVGTVLHGEDEVGLEALNLREYLYAGGVSLIEWFERLPAEDVDEHLEVKIAHAGGSEREFVFIAHGERYERLLEEFKSSRFNRSKSLR